MAEYMERDGKNPESGTPFCQPDYPPVMLIAASDDDLAEAKKCARMLRANGVCAEIVSADDTGAALRSAWDGKWLFVVLFEPESDEDECRDELRTGLQWCGDALLFRRMADGSTCIYALSDTGGEPVFVRRTETPEEMILSAAYAAMDSYRAERRVRTDISRSASEKRNARKIAGEAAAAIIALLAGFLLFAELNDCMGDIAEPPELPEISADAFEDLPPLPTLDFDALEEYSSTVSTSDAAG